MRDRCSVVLIGHIGQNPELKITPTGKQMLRLSLATSERWTDPDTKAQKEQTEWHTIVVWGKEAEVLSQMAKKGDRWMFEGKIHYNEFTKTDGTKVKETQIMAKEFAKMEKNMSVGGSTSTGEWGREPDSRSRAATKPYLDPTEPLF
jgi:single-strand DNA-binding protein